MHYTPRYAIYLAAFQVFERLPARFRDAGRTTKNIAAGDAMTQPALDLRRLSALLPCCSANGRERSWEQITADITANYREFVTGTRA
jgi:hypothetical protein